MEMPYKRKKWNLLNVCDGVRVIAATDEDKIGVRLFEFKNSRKNGDRFYWRIATWSEIYQTYLEIPAIE